MRRRDRKRLPLPARQEMVLEVIKTIFKMGLLFYINIRFTPGFMWCVFPIFFMILKLIKNAFYLRAQNASQEEEQTIEFMDLREVEQEEIIRKKSWKESDLV